MAFVGEGVSLGRPLRFQKVSHSQLSLCHVFVDQDVCSLLLHQHHAYLPAVVLLAIMIMDSPSETVSLNKLFPLRVSLAIVSSQQQRSN